MWLFIAAGFAVIALMSIISYTLTKDRKTEEVTLCLAIGAFVIATLIMLFSWIGSADTRSSAQKCADSGKVYVWDQCLNEDQLKLMQAVKSD